MRAPGLVDDERHALGVGDLGEPAHVGDGAEVGRRDGDRADRVRGRRERVVERLRRDAVRESSSGSSSGATNAGSSPAITSPSIVEEWTFRCTTTRDPEWRSVTQAAWFPCDAPLIRNQLRRAPQASAASCCASSKGVG